MERFYIVYEYRTKWTCDIFACELDIRVLLACATSAIYALRWSFIEAKMALAQIQTLQNYFQRFYWNLLLWCINKHFLWTFLKQWQFIMFFMINYSVVPLIPTYKKINASSVQNIKENTDRQQCGRAETV